MLSWPSWLTYGGHYTHIRYILNIDIDIATICIEIEKVISKHHYSALWFLRSAHFVIPDVA